MTIARRFANPLEIHCQHCRGKGQILCAADMDAPIMRVDCRACAGTGLRDAEDASSAQPHRFATDHPMLVTKTD